MNGQRLAGLKETALIDLSSKSHVRVSKDRYSQCFSLPRLVSNNEVIGTLQDSQWIVIYGITNVSN